MIEWEGPEYVNQAEMARILRCTAPTVKRMEDEGVISPAYRYNRTVRYNPGEVIKQLEEYRDKELARKRPPPSLGKLIEMSTGKR